MAVRPRVVALPPREIFRPWDAEVFGHSAHDDWYREAITWGPLDRHSINSADDWWAANIEVGDGWYAFGMPYPSSKSEIDWAYAYYIGMAMNLVREHLIEQLS